MNNQQEEHVEYTRNEWTTVKVFTDILNYLKTKLKFITMVKILMNKISTELLESEKQQN